MFNIMNCLAESGVSFSLSQASYTDNPVMRIYKEGTALSVEREVQPDAYSVPKKYDIWSAFEGLISDANTMLNTKNFDEYIHDHDTIRQARKSYSEGKSEAKKLLAIFNGDLQPITDAVWADDKIKCSKCSKY